MGKNPLGDDWIGTGPSRITLEFLQNYADQLNAKHWCREAKIQWFVNSRKREDGSREHYLDRHEKQDATPYHPSDEEASATHAVVAELIRKGVEQHEFTNMVRNGTVPRLVFERMHGDGT